ncbi:hypothetical protein NN6n1_04660 [Shinella zoogloeoides]
MTKTIRFNVFEMNGVGYQPRRPRRHPRDRSCRERAYATGYRDGTLRGNLFGDGLYLPESQPAHCLRDIERVEAAKTAGRAA